MFSILFQVFMGTFRGWKSYLTRRITPFCSMRNPNKPNWVFMLNWFFHYNFLFNWSFPISAIQHLDKAKLWGKQIRVAASKHMSVQMPKEGQPVKPIYKNDIKFFFTNENLFIIIDRMPVWPKIFLSPHCTGSRNPGVKTIWTFIRPRRLCTYPTFRKLIDFRASWIILEQNWL